MKKKIIASLLISTTIGLAVCFFTFDKGMTIEERDYIEKLNEKHSAIRHLNYVSAFVVGYLEAKRNNTSLHSESRARPHEMIQYKTVGPHVMPFDLLDVQAQDNGRIKMTFGNKHVYTQSFCKMTQNLPGETPKRVREMAITECHNGRMSVVSM